MCFCFVGETHLWYRCVHLNGFEFNTESIFLGCIRTNLRVYIVLFRNNCSVNLECWKEQVCMKNQNGKNTDNTNDNEFPSPRNVVVTCFHFTVLFIALSGDPYWLWSWDSLTSEHISEWLMYKINANLIMQMIWGVMDTGVVILQAGFFCRRQTKEVVGFVVVMIAILHQWRGRCCSLQQLLQKSKWELVQLIMVQAVTVKNVLFLRAHSLCFRVQRAHKLAWKCFIDTS